MTMVNGQDIQNAADSDYTEWLGCSRQSPEAVNHARGVLDALDLTFEPRVWRALGNGTAHYKACRRTFLTWCLDHPKIRARAQKRLDERMSVWLRDALKNNDTPRLERLAVRAAAMLEDLGE